MILAGCICWLVKIKSIMSLIWDTTTDDIRCSRLGVALAGLLVGHFGDHTGAIHRNILSFHLIRVSFPL